MSNEQIPAERSNPLLWTVALVGFTVGVAWWFAYMFEGGVHHAVEHPVEVTAGPSGPAVPDHAELIGSLKGGNKDMLQLGKQVYAANCTTCHGADGGVPKVEGARNFRTEPFGNGVDPYSMYRTLTEGYSGGQYQMPAQNMLDAEQKYAVIHYLRQEFVKPHNDAQEIAAITDDYISSGEWPPPSEGGDQAGGYHGDEYEPTAPILGAVVQRHRAVDPEMARAFQTLRQVAASESAPELSAALRELTADPAAGGFALQLVRAAQDDDLDRMAALFADPGRNRFQPALALLSRSALDDLARALRTGAASANGAGGDE